MKTNKLISILLIAAMLLGVPVCSYASYEDTEYFLTEVTYLKTSDYVQVKQEFTTIDLAPYATSSYSDEVSGDNQGGWTDEGAKNDMSHFNLVGRNTFFGIPFDFVDPSTNNGKGPIVLAGRGATFVPESIEIPINQSAAGLYIACCHAWNYGDGDKKGEFTLVYEDGTSASVELIENENIHNFWGAVDYADFRNIWKGNHPVGGQENAVGMFAMSNPYPEKKIKSFYATSMDGGTKSWLMVLAITLTDSGPYLPDIGLRGASGSISTIVSDDKFEIAPGSALDLSAQLEKPAGKHGVLLSDGDNLIFSDGERFRIWGINLELSDSLQNKETADKIATDIVRLGYNTVRIKIDPLNYDKSKKDAFQYIFSSLKNNGIYTYLALGNEKNNNIMFDDELIQKQIDGINDILGYNPYTSQSVASDSSLAMLEFAPESGLYYYDPDVVSDVNSDLLSEKFSKWLISKYKNDSALKKAWNTGDGAGLGDNESAEKSTVVLDKFWKMNNLYSSGKNLDIRRFYKFVQEEYYAKMKECVSLLGYNGISTCNSNPLDDIALGDTYINASTDYIARNMINGYSKNGNDFSKSIYFTTPLSTSLKKTGLGIVGNLSRHKISGLPYVISEWNSANAGDNYTEDYLIMAAYAAKQNWNPICSTYASKNYTNETKITGLYDIYNNYTSRSAQIAASKLYNAVSQSDSVKVYNISEDDLLMDGLRPHYMILLDHKVEKIINADKFENFYTSKVSYMRNDTANYKENPPGTGIYKENEIMVDTVNGAICVITDMAEAYSGTSKQKNLTNLKIMQLDMETESYTAFLTSVNGKPLKEDSMLLTLTGSAKNKAFSISNNEISITGKAQIQLQVIQGTVTLKDKGVFDVYSLNYDGSRKNQLSTYVNQDGYTVFKVNYSSYANDVSSLNFEIVRR